MSGDHDDVPGPIGRTALVARWEQAAFCHWRADPAAVRAVLPAGFDVDECDGSAWVGLMPCHTRVRLPFLPWLGGLLDFASTTARTFVRDPDGEPALWCFSIEASHLPAVVMGRVIGGLPLNLAHMQVVRADDVVTYTTRRRWPRSPDADSGLTVKIGDRCQPQELNELDRFLTSRWTMYATGRRGVRRVRAWYQPWPLHRAEVLAFGDELLGAAGVAVPAVDPVVHWSPGVEARIGKPHRPGW